MTDASGGFFGGLVALAAVLLLAPLMPGVASRTKSFLTGRRGAPVTQLYRDLWRLARKGSVYSVTATAVFRAAPLVVLAAALGAALLVPLDGHRALLAFPGDAIALLYLFALGRFLLILGALDTGSSFEGMGASREATIATFVEPGLCLCFLALAASTGRLDLSGMLGAPLAARWTTAAPALFMVAVSLFVLLLAENARVPVDDPATHLELTMVHEVMVLDHSGAELAAILYAGALKLALFAALVVGVVVPRGALSWPASLGTLAVGMAAVAAGVGVVESAMARLRMPKVPLFLVAGSTAAALALLLVLYQPAP